MSPDELNPADPIDDLTQSVSDGRDVDWDAVRTNSQGIGERRVRGLHDLWKIAQYHRQLHRTPAPGAPERIGPEAGAPPGVSPSESWGHLTLLELVSAGAAGEVWRAWDTWLRREVALKFLRTVSGPEPGGAGESDGTSESDLLEESRALARVRHPGVVGVYGIAEYDGRVGMWMELLHGGTLKAAIDRRGALPVEEVAQIGLELARALEAIEAAGLVHRDIKPANIVLEQDGRAVLTDFGLGRRFVTADLELWRSSGTPLFMAPEVLAGEPATPSSDVYSLGVTLRWALTGRPPFRANSIEELEVEAASGPAQALAAERPDAPAALVRAIERAMAPRGDQREASAAQLAKALEAIVHPASPVRGRSLWTRIAAVAAAVLLLGLAAWSIERQLGNSVRPQVIRWSVAAPPNTMLSEDPASAAISPDGRLLAFTAMDSSGISRLWLRQLDTFAARPLPGTEQAFSPFWSPDSRNLGFFARGKLLKVSAFGGQPEILCNAPDPRGGSWGRRGFIVFAPLAIGSLCRISEAGGLVDEIVVPDSIRGEAALRWPQFLPDGEHFLCVSLPPKDGNFDVHVAGIDSPERKQVLRTGAAPLCAGENRLILASNGRLQCQRFDFRRLEPIGEPVLLGSASAFDVSVGQPLASVSMNGILVRPTMSLSNTQLVWMDRAGNRQGVLPLPEGRYEAHYFSPDRSCLIARRRTSPTAVDLCKIDLEGGLVTRFTHGSQSRLGGVPVWSPDGSRVAFSSNRQGKTGIYQRATDTAAEEELVYQPSGQFAEVEGWSRDGRYLVLEQADRATGWDLWLLPLAGDRKPIPYLRTRFNEVGCCFSRDGRWMSYTGDATGRVEVYVRSFPDAGGEHLVTNVGGVRAFWTRRGDEILVANTETDRCVWSVPVTTEPTFKSGTPRLLFRMPGDALWLAPTPEGDRFLATLPSGDAEPTTIAVEVNWPAQIGW